MTRDLRPLFDPTSVAILGASNDPAKWGNWLARGALRGSHRRDVWLVNRNGGEVLGVQTHRSIDELPGTPELVVVAVPAAGVEQAVDDSLAKGARAIVGITAGLGEAGGDALAREQAMVERVRSAGAMLLGPNCLGVYDATSELGLASNEFPPGSVGLISQSGNLALELGILARPYEMGFSRFASIGNQADLDLAELVSSFAQHEATRAIAVYAEDFRDGRGFVDAVAAAGKPVVVLAVGRSKASERAAKSHTGALVSNADIAAAACRAAGAHMVTTPGEMIDTLQVLLTDRRLKGRRVGVLSDGGGHAAIACDTAADNGLEVPEFSPGLKAALAAQLPDTAATGNPIDLAGGGEQDFFNYARTAHMMLASEEIDGVLMTGYFGGYSQYSEDFAATEAEVAHQIAASVRELGLPMVAQTMYADSPPAQALRKGGIAVYPTIEAATAALASLADEGEGRGAPALPAVEHGPLPGDYHGARTLLAGAGVPFVAAREAAGEAEALAAAGELGYPVVLKAMGLLHKSDAGGVKVGIGSDAELSAAVADMTARLAPASFSVERMAPLNEGVELIVGCKRDPRFGSAIVVGLGGIHTELFRDVASALAPIDEAAAEKLLGALRGAALLGPARGRPAADVPAAARVVAALSRLAAARPDIGEIDVNPLLVTPGGALALDARIIPTVKEGGHAG